MEDRTMNPTLFEIGVVVFILAVSVAALVVWFLRHAAASSEKRMTHMLTRASVDPEFSGHDDIWAILHVARGRCSACRSEKLCDRWLAGNVGGDNSFCPNAQILRILERITRRVPASICSGHHAQATTLTLDARNVVRTGVDRDPSIRLTPSINSPISAVL
jgi:hypothetical protein